MLEPNHNFSKDLVKAVLLKIQDGFKFEDLVKQLLQEKYGWAFSPVGGVHDGGVDSFVYHGGNNNEIIQLSIQKTWKNKIKKTIQALRKNTKLNENMRFTYVTPLQLMPLEKSDLIEEIRMNEGVALDFKDQDFLYNLINSSLAIRTIFSSFCTQFSVVDLLDSESVKVFGSKRADKTIVFLKHFIEEETHKDYLESLVKTHFVFALIDTDPDENKFKTRKAIDTFIYENLPNINRERITNIVSGFIEQNRLTHRDEREFRDHGDKYCLAFTVRQQVMEWQANDIALYEDFKSDLLVQMDLQSIDNSLTYYDEIPDLIRDSLAEIFRYQGLSFMSFIVDDNVENLQIDLPEITQKIVKESELRPGLHDEAINVCTDVLYELIWKPSAGQKDFMNAMAKTYSLMFTGKADTQVLDHLKASAKGTHFIFGTDLIIKMLSEILLKPEHQRFTNLVRSMSKIDVQIRVSQNILIEAASHIRKTIRWYDEYISPLIEDSRRQPEYCDVINFEEQYSGLILIRAYHHAKIAGKIKSLDDFFKRFLSGPPLSVKIEDDLKNFLRGEFGITLESEFIDESSPEFKWLFDQVSSVILSDVSDDHKEKIAKNDAGTIYCIYQLRRKDTVDQKQLHIFPEKVWWLTTESKIERLRNDLKDKFGEMPNMSPVAALALLSNISELEKSSSNLTDVLSSALGLNMSHFVDNSVLDQLHITFEEVKNMGGGQKAVYLGKIVERLRRGKVKQIQDSIQSVFDKERDYTKKLEPYWVIRSNEGFGKVWEAIKNDYQDISYRLKLFSLIKDTSMKKCVHWLRDNGFEKDVSEISKISVKFFIEDQESADS